jgi:hypothetical protein
MVLYKQMILNNYMYITKHVVLTLHVTETIGQTFIVNVTYTFLRLNELFSLPQKKSIICEVVHNIDNKFMVNFFCVSCNANMYAY